MDSPATLHTWLDRSLVGCIPVSCVNELVPGSVFGRNRDAALDRLGSYSFAYGLAGSDVSSHQFDEFDLRKSKQFMHLDVDFGKVPAPAGDQSRGADGVTLSADIDIALLLCGQTQMI